MPESIQEIAASLARRLETWLEAPNEATTGLDELRKRIEALRGSIGAGATSEALRALSSSEKSIRATRQREAADAIASACRELGVVLSPGAPLKRTRRKRKGPQLSETEARSHDAATETEPSSQRSLLPRRAQ